MSSTFLKSGFDHPAAGLPARREEPKKRLLTRVFSRAGNWFHTRPDQADRHRLPRLRLEFPDRFIDFHSMREFEFALRSRTEFPAARVRDLIALAPVELEDSATRIRLVERDFADILARAVHHPELIGEYFREIELKLFSNDHGWRETMEGLIRLSPAYDAYKRVALIKYMQYLRARQNIMRALFIETTKGDDNVGIHATRKFEDATPSATSTTTIFDLASKESGNDEGHNYGYGDGYGDGASYTALAKGETVTLHLGEEREVELLLAGNRLRLYTGRESYLADDDNNTYPLHTGKNLVGRHSVCDVMLDPACRAVSRNHLIVQPVSAREVQLTDLSAHGTEVPTHLLRRH